MLFRRRPCVSAWWRSSSSSLSFSRESQQVLRCDPVFWRLSAHSQQQDQNDLIRRRRRRRQEPILSTPTRNNNKDVTAAAPGYFANTSMSRIEDECLFLEQQITELNGGRPLNIKSPKQVSMAIFGTIQSVTQPALVQQIQQTLTPGSNQQRLAMYILKLKQIQAQQQKQQQRSSSSNKRGTVFTRAFSSAVTRDETGAEDLLKSEEKQEREKHTKNTLTEVLLQEEEEEDEEESIDGPSLKYPENSNVFSKISSSHLDDFMLGSDEEEELTYAQLVESLFLVRRGRLSEYWKQHLLDLKRLTAKNLVQQLDSDGCSMGYGLRDGKSPPFVQQCRQYKDQHPDFVLLTRCGDFYEAYGVDAILLVEHAGLNSMGKLVKAGCPKANIQATLDSLTDAGFSVAVVEETTNTQTKGKIKDRFFSQIVSPSSPNYLYGLKMKEETPNDYYPRPYVGVVRFAAGYTLVEIGLEDQSVRILERLTDEGVAAHLAANPPAEPLLYVPLLGGTQEYYSQQQTWGPVWSSRRIEDGGRAREIKLKLLNPTLLPDATSRLKDEAQRATSFILKYVLDDQKDRYGENTPIVTEQDFTILQKQRDTTRTKPLFWETAKQLGVIPDIAIPSLLPYILDRRAPAATKNSVKQWLTTPPPLQVANAMASLIHFSSTSSQPLPRMIANSVGRLLPLLRTGQANPAIYAEIYHSLKATSQILSLLHEKPDVMKSLQTVLEYEAGLACPDPQSLREKCNKAADIIENVIAQGVLINKKQGTDECSNFPSNNNNNNDGDDEPPPEYWQRYTERNESPWRGRVRRSAASHVYERVEQAARELAKSIQEDFDNLEVVYDNHQNLLSVKLSPKANKPGQLFPLPVEKGKKRYSSKRVQSHHEIYLASCAEACMEVEAVLGRLNSALQEGGYVPTIVLAARTNLIFSIAHHHACQAISQGWNRADVILPSEEDDREEVKMLLKNVWPYWMERSTAVANDIEMRGMWILTAPNSSGKSTLMRSTAAAALLSICGFCAPLDPGSRVSWFDNIFVRGASSDVPTEGKSAFGAEMSEVTSMLKGCGPRSLVFVDELGRGTSPDDGTKLAGSILMEMAEKGMTGIFATHLHGILDLPYSKDASDRLSKKRMKIVHMDDDDVAPSAINERSWTFQLEDGECRDSRAFLTAKQFGIPAHIIERAKSFSVSSSANWDLRLNPHAELGSSIMDNNAIAQQPEQYDTKTILSWAEGWTTSDPIEIPPMSNPPAFLINKSCLYLLEIPNDMNGSSTINGHGGGGASGQHPMGYYIGETDNIHTRIRNHRQKIHSQLVCFVYVVSDKTEARDYETLWIQKCAKAGVDLISTKDGQHSVQHRPRL